jgi:hypothetical protein
MTMSGSVSSVQSDGTVLPLDPLATLWCLAQPVYLRICGDTEISCEISIRNERKPMYTECAKGGPIWKRSCIQWIRLRNSFFPNLLAMRKQASIYRELWNSAVSNKNMNSILVSSSHSHFRNKASTTEDRFPCERTIHLRLYPRCAGRADCQESFLRPLGTFPLKEGILLNHSDRCRASSQFRRSSFAGSSQFRKVSLEHP